MFLLDTNIVSELRKAKSKNVNQDVIQWVKDIAESSLFISVITVLELEMGILLLERRDPKQAAVLRTWLTSQVLPAFDQRILPIDTAVAQCCAKLHVPNPCSERDSLIAATALVHGLTVVTRNASDFKTTGVKILNPFLAHAYTAR